MRGLAITVAVCLATSTARADFFDAPQVASFGGLDREMESVASALSLSEDETRNAKNVAVTWFYLGPCRGLGSDIPGGDKAAIQVVQGARPVTKFGAAILQMIAILVRQDILGRTAPQNACDFAKAMANAG